MGEVIIAVVIIALFFVSLMYAVYSVSCVIEKADEFTEKYEGGDDDG